LLLALILSTTACTLEHGIYADGPATGHDDGTDSSSPDDAATDHDETSDDDGADGSGSTDGPDDPADSGTDTGDDDTADDNDTPDHSDDDDTSDDGADDTTSDPEPDPEPEPDPLAGLGPGMQWIRTNPMFITGLVVSMDSPSTETVDTYFDNFGASALHTWSQGLPNRVAGWQACGRPDFQFLSWVQTDGTSRDGGAVIGGIAPDTAGRIGYQVGDEPRNFADIDETVVGVQAVRGADPDALVVINFGNPEEGTDLLDLLNYAITELDPDVISYDWYGYDYSTTYDRLAIHREVALDHGLPYWRYLNSYQDVGATDWPEESDMRWNAMAGVVYGYTGHTWFVYQAAPPHAVWSALFEDQGLWSSPATARFAIASELNEQLTVFGEVLPWLTSTEIRYTPGFSMYAPTGTIPWSPGAGGDPYISSIDSVGDLPWETQDILVGFFIDDDGDRYVALQNPTHASADWPIMASDTATFEVELDFSSAPASVARDHLLVLNHHDDTVDQAPLNGGGDQRMLSVILDAGDVILFKYATGAGFAGR